MRTPTKKKKKKKNMEEEKRRRRREDIHHEARTGLDTWRVYTRSSLDETLLKIFSGGTSTEKK